MEQLETEIKFYLANPLSIREQILELGAESRERLFESNVRFEDAHKTLKQQNCLLRLRRDQKATLTFKSTPAEEASNQFKIMKELEVEVNDFNTMHSILESLGYHCEQIYEKWRETLILNQTLFCLDCMPYGNFLEIEGQPKDIKDLTARLNLPWEKRILLNYIQIFEILKTEMALNFSDVTFENFNNIEVDLADYLELLEAGE